MGVSTSGSTVSELLARVIRELSVPSKGATRSHESAPKASGAAESVLLASAARYCPPLGNLAVTPPTGFDLEAGALFEAIVESAFIVANADGHFDEVERHAFAEVVLEASGRRVVSRQIEAIVTDLGTQLGEDGLERRLAYLSKTIKNDAHRHEVLLIATLLAEISAGVSDVERRVLEQLAAAFGLQATTVDEALEHVRESLAS